MVWGRELVVWARGVGHLVQWDPKSGGLRSSNALCGIDLAACLSHVGVVAAELGLAQDALGYFKREVELYTLPTKQNDVEVRPSPSVACLQGGLGLPQPKSHVALHLPCLHPACVQGLMDACVRLSHMHVAMEDYSGAIDASAHVCLHNTPSSSCADKY